MRKTLLAISMVLVGTGLVSDSCRRSAAEEPRPVADQTTPDNAVKSYWTDANWLYRDGNRYFLEVLNGQTLYAPATLDLLRQRARHENESGLAYTKEISIDRVDIQSESRAIVWVIKPADHGKAKTKYLLTRQGKSWVIEDILTECVFCNGKGEVQDFEQAQKDMELHNCGTHPMKTCAYCKGKGWTSQIIPNDEESK